MNAGTLWFDVTDLVRHHGTWTGIQRAVTGFAAGLQTCANPPTLRYCHFQPDRGFVAMDAAMLAELIDVLQRVRDKPRRRWLDKFGALLQRGSRELADPFANGDVLMNTGLYTYKEDWRPGIAAILARRQLRYAGFVHDLMHINYPEWWSPREQARIAGWYRFVCGRAAVLLCASAATRREIERFQTTENLPPAPVTITGLAGTLPSAELPAGADTGPVEPPYVLFVSTLEVRKNHRLLVYLWRRLRERLGDDRLPTLVFVGKQGHLIGDLLAELDNCRWLDGKIRWLRQVTDADLARLYRHSLFTVYPSLYEGWGLPVAESLAFGKYGIATNRGALPEVGGALFDYHDPLDLPGALELILRAVTDPGYVAAKEAAIAQDYRPRSWEDCARAALAGLTAPAASAARLAATAVPA
jgi:glycosyltransferase involved in cell wall biosynthesis